MRKRQMQQSVQLAASAVVKDRMVFRVFVLREGDNRFKCHVLREEKVM